MDVSGWFAKIKGWLVVAIPAAIGIAIAVVMRKSPSADPSKEPVAKGPDMAQADSNAKTLEKEQVVLADQHKTIEETLKPRPVVIQPDKSLEDAVNAYNKDK